MLFLLISHAMRYAIKIWQLKLRKLSIIIPRVLIITILGGFTLQLADFSFQIGLSQFFSNHSFDYAFFSNTILLNFIYDSIILFMWNVLYFMFHFINNFKKEELKNLQWEAKINEIELNKLKSQMNPHFIFNSMNGIRALIDEDPVKAKTSVTKLSNILRNTLVMNRNKVISFEEEMKVVYDYLDLEGIRFEERLQTHFNINPLSKAFFVPPLMLQTIVENAIKHGISNLEKGGLISIETLLIDNKLEIEIKNSGSLRENYMEHAEGFGLANTQQRLMLLYGENASFDLYEDNGFVIAKFSIPKYIEFPMK